MDSPWLSCADPRPGAAMRLVCIPYAGGGASAFRPWSQDLGTGVEVWCAELPGRERRFREPPVTTMAGLVPPVVDAIVDRVRPPVALFGHSMGGLAALEVAHRLPECGGPPPAHLFVSGARAPHLPRARAVHLLDDDRLEAWLVRVGGLPAEVVADRDLLALLLPTIRADLDVCASFRHRLRAPLGCSIHAFAGAADPVAPRADMAGWVGYTSAAFALTVLPGDHFFLHPRRRSITSVIVEVAAGAAARVPGRVAGESRVAEESRVAGESRVAEEIGTP
jgi:surfactin synthase thioesterase subunit